MKQVRIEEQISAAMPDRSVVLSASAGSGKTHVLVRRIIHLLLAGTAPEDIAAITFTEKAAAQMKDKLFGELARGAWDGSAAHELLGIGPSEAPLPLTRTPEEVFSGLTVRPDAPRISTIHAFCLSILRQFPLEAGLPAGFLVMDESEGPTRREQAAADCLDGLPGTELETDFIRLMDAGLDVQALESLIVLALGKRGRLAMLEAEQGGGKGFGAMLCAIEETSGLAEKKREFEGSLMSGPLGEGAGRLAGMADGFGPALEDYAAALRALSRVKGPEEFPAAFSGVRDYFYTKAAEPTLRKGSPVSLKAAAEALKAAHPTSSASSIREMARGLASAHDALYEEVRAEATRLAGLYDGVTAAGALSSFLRLCNKADGLYTKSKRRDGLVDYDDLEICAYRLLRNPDAQRLLSRLEARTVHLLVDEFQDTSRLQWGIVSTICSEVFAGSGREGLKAPTLFAVGDAKQSIYRFRNADHRLMGELRERMTGRVEENRRAFPELDINFRSAPEVVRVVNETFGSLFGDGYRDARAAAGGAGGAGGSVVLRLVPEPEEPDALARSVEDALGLPVRHGTCGTGRAGYGDMAVLLRSRSGLKAYEEALAARGIPYKVVGGVGFFYQKEVQALIDLLGYLEDPSDTLRLASALKSPIFRLSDGELEPIYRAADPMEELSAVSSDAHRLISGWRAVSGLVPVGRLLERIVRDSAALLCFGLDGGPAAALNVEKLIGVARGYERGGGLGLGGFTEWVKAYRDKADMPTADVELPEYSDFVRIMTVHAAKGLEFPVVFLPGASRETSKTADGLLFGGGGGDEGPAVALKTGALLGDNPGYSALKKAERQERESETRRLLYVAMTRAMDHLLIIAGLKRDEPSRPPARESWLGCIAEASPPSLLGKGFPPADCPAVYRHPEEEPVRYYEKAHEPPVPEVPADHGRLAEDLSFVPACGGVSFISPSSLAALPANMRRAGDSKSMLRGIIIHAMLERCGRHGQCDRDALERIAAGIPAVSLMPMKERAALLDDVNGAVSSFLSHEAAAGILSGEAIRHFELPLLLRRDEEVINGKADLVVVRGDRADVYDYKSGMAALTDEALAEAYGAQLAAYCEAVAEAFGAAEVAGHLVLVDALRVIDIPSVETRRPDRRH